MEQKHEKTLMVYRPVETNGNDFSRAADEFTRSGWGAILFHRKNKQIAEFVSYSEIKRVIPSYNM